jgi:hypothetical protein
MSSELVPIDPALLEWADAWYPVAWKGLLMAGAITALAAFATIAFLLLQWRTTGIRERHSEWRTQVLELQTAEAKRDTVAAQERIAELNNETARLRESGLATLHAQRDSALGAEVTRAVTEALAIAQGSVKREATSEATRALYIVPKVTPFAGKKFDAVVTSIALDLGGLVRTLRAALKMAGWIEIERPDPAAGVEIFSMDRAGGPALVRIHVDAGKDPELLDAAKTLASALNAEAIAAIIKTEPDATNANVIHILVGPKP